MNSTGAREKSYKLANYGEPTEYEINECRVRITIQQDDSYNAKDILNNLQLLHPSDPDFTIYTGRDRYGNPDYYDESLGAEDRLAEDYLHANRAQLEIDAIANMLAGTGPDTIDDDLLLEMAREQLSHDDIDIKALALWTEAAKPSDNTLVALRKNYDGTIDLLDEPHSQCNNIDAVLVSKTPITKDQAAHIVSMYNDWVTGNIHGYTIELLDEEDNVVDKTSCWELFGDYEYCFDEVIIAAEELCIQNSQPPGPNYSLSNHSSVA